MIGQISENTNLDPLLWAKRQQSQLAVEAVFKEAKGDPRFAEIRDKLIADGVCAEDGKVEYVWSFAAQKFVRPAWYQRANYEDAA